MKYKFLENSFDIKNGTLPSSNCINEFVLKNNHKEITKALNFLNSEQQFLYVHGCLGTGKRQFINYISNFLSKNVIKLEYYCKPSTVCDDILLYFINYFEKNNIYNISSFNTKITTLNVKFQQYIDSTQKPIIIILHSFDDICDENRKLVSDLLEHISKNKNIKIIASTKPLALDMFENLNIDCNIFLKALSKDLFKEFIESYKIKCTDTTLEDFYKYTRGYYYYTILSLKIVEASRISLNEFLTKFTQSGSDFDAYLGMTYLNIIPDTIRNFFWFLRTLRHGISLNALAIFELYDDFSIEYLKNNLIIYISDENIYVQDFFQQKINISIPNKTEIKLHKYIIDIYEKQLKEPLKIREIMISRQALRSEIEYHKNCIIELNNIPNRKQIKPSAQNTQKENKSDKPIKQETDLNISQKLEQSISLYEQHNNTIAINSFLEIINNENIDNDTLLTAKKYLARLYKQIHEYSTSELYYETLETYYKKHKEVINLNYLYYELTDLYYSMYKNERAIETIKKVIYSVDTPQSLMVSASTLLGNIYSSINKPNDAYTYYKKAIESLDSNTSQNILSELYFKYALANDDRGDNETAYTYYTKCITESPKTNEYKALAYSNLGSCYYDNNNYSDARDCFEKAYNIDKINNNYEGIYFNASHLASIFLKSRDKQALKYLLEAIQCAEFTNDTFELLKSTIALGDYYYNNKTLNDKALTEYFKALKAAETLGNKKNIQLVQNRIKDMKLRMDTNSFNKIESKYE